MKKPNAYIFIGRSGCGKGTQVELLKKYLCEHDQECKTVEIESGELLRNFAKGDSFSEKKCNEVLNKGGLIPEFLVVGLWAHKLMEELTGQENLICDGTPRKLNEARVLKSVFDFYGFDKVHVIYMDVSRDWSKKHLLGRKRADDTEEDIENRLNWFDTDVIPTVDYYREDPRYNFLSINGEQTIEEVNNELMTKLEYK